MAATPAWLAAIEALLNRGISGSRQAQALARRLDGTALHVELEGLRSVRASVANGRLALIAAAAAGETAVTAPDATIAGTPLALMQLARGGATRGAASTSARVRGDAEIAGAYKQLFELAGPDLEEELSRIVGDLPARRLSQFAMRSVAWARRTRRTAGENVAEYLQEESRDLVNQPELTEFLRGVDTLRETADRVEARLTQLERRLKGAL